MLTLNSRNVVLKGIASSRRSIVARVSASASNSAEASNHLTLFSPNAGFDGEPLPLLLERDAAIAKGLSACVIVPDEFEYLEDGDVVAVQLNRPALRVLYRKQSLHNTFLLTEQCNHYCLMCSQPPKTWNDYWLADELFEAIPLAWPGTSEIGFTGGEPTLLGDRFLQLIRCMTQYLPNTRLHILTNGRRFSESHFCAAYADANHPDCVLGIPIYSPHSGTHDYIVQASGAFDETIRGILNLKALKQRVEIRVVIHKENFQHLPALADFIARNLTFADHVALMGLEMTGFAIANIPLLWVDPVEYKEHLYRAATMLDDLGIPTSIYNHQLCTIDTRIWRLATRSISDWKNEYVEQCSTCVVRDQCGGFFSTGRVRRSSHIQPIANE